MKKAAKKAAPKKSAPTKIKKGAGGHKRSEPKPYPKLPGGIGGTTNPGD